MIRATSHPQYLARIERPLMAVPLLDEIFVRSIGLVLRFRADGQARTHRPR